VRQSKFQVLAIQPDLVSAATKLCRQYSLLTNDSLILAVMQQHQLTHLASNDTDFDRVPGVTRYAPT
jgi:predicted nucleic acid-binding protein